MLAGGLATGDAVAQQEKAAAPNAADDWAGVEEMIVTGSAAVDVMLEAPTSVLAFDQNALNTVGALNISDLAEYTPNLEINSPYAASNPQLFIRGVGLQDSNSNASAAVAIVMDNVYMNSPAGQLSSLFDIESVEVLRGPQGAVYGRNASAGVVRVNTRRPEHDVSGGMTLTYGRFSQLEADGFVNIPIVQDVVATRVAFKYASRNPLGINRCNFDEFNNFPSQQTRLIGTKCFAGMVSDPSRFNQTPLAAPPSNTNDRENWYGRWSTLVEPTDDLKFVWKIHGGQNLGLAPQFQNRGEADVRDPLVPGGFLPDIQTSGRRYIDYDTCHRVATNGDCLRNDRFPGAGHPFSGDYGVGGSERLTLAGTTLNTEWESGPWKLLSVTNYDYNDREVIIDFDASPYIQADAFITDTAWQFLQDTKLTWNDQSGIALTLGLQYFQEDLDADNNFWNTASTNLSQQYEQNTKAAAAFARVEWELTETVIFEGGARANYERKNFEISSDYLTFSGGEPIFSIAGYEDRRELAEQVKPSGEIIMRWEPTDDLKFYGRFTRGYKGQHFNGNALGISQPIDPIKAESVNAYEIGWHMNWFDGLVDWNGAGFYYDYENQQVYTLQDGVGVSIPVPILLNAEDSRLIGGESDITVEWEGIRWFNSIGIIYSEYSDFRLVNIIFRVSPGGGVSESTEIRDYSGNSLVNAPEFSLVGFIEYGWEMPVGGTLTPRFDYRYKSQVFYTPENDSRIGADPRWLFDAHLDYKTPDGNIMVSGWIRNLTDEYYAVTAYDRKKGVGAIVYVVSDPRTYGLTVSYKF